VDARAVSSRDRTNEIDVTATRTTDIACIRRDVVTAARACAAAFDEGAAH